MNEVHSFHTFLSNSMQEENRCEDFPFFLTSSWLINPISVQNGSMARPWCWLSYRQSHFSSFKSGLWLFLAKSLCQAVCVSLCRASWLRHCFCVTDKTPVDGTVKVTGGRLSLQSSCFHRLTMQSIILSRWSQWKTPLLLFEHDVIWRPNSNLQANWSSF